MDEPTGRPRPPPVTTRPPCSACPSAFGEQVVLSLMVRNGDAHLKNFGMLYDDPQHPRLSPLFDVVTTSIYPIERPGAEPAFDRTMALKLRRGRHDGGRSYPSVDELMRFGRQCCGVREPMGPIERVAEGMRSTLADAANDDRVGRTLWQSMRDAWVLGVAYVRRG